ncbi:MAG: glycosyltransferase family 2 protein [bacterium]
MRSDVQATLTVVVPCFNEEAVIPSVITDLHAFAGKLPCKALFLFVNDGSSDRTAELLDRACESDDRIGCIHFSRNFGHQIAVSAGLRHARGELVAVIDADLQDPPSVIAEMIGKWREGYDVVYGVRTNRKEGWLLRMAYAGFYRMLSRLSNVDLPLDAGDFSLMDRRVVDEINRMPEHNRFVRGLRGWVGYRQIGLPYERQARQAGKPKYNLRRLFNLAIEGFINFSSVPLRIASWIGALASLLGFGLLVWAIVSSLVLQRLPPGWASLVVMVLFFGGIQLLVLGIIGEYIGRIFDEVKNRPHFVVASQSGWARKDASAP